GIDGVRRVRGDYLWSRVAATWLSVAVVVIELAVGDVSLPIGEETSGHQYQGPIVVTAKREDIVATQIGIGDGRGDGNAQACGGRGGRILFVTGLDRERTESADLSWCARDQTFARLVCAIIVQRQSIR